jgi:predicted nucleic-acid-binding protein
VIALDTDVLVRYVTDDDPIQSPAAAQFIESALSTARPGFICLVTLAELAWVLRSRHRASTAEVIVVVEELASDLRFRLQDHQAVWLALEIAASADTDFPDALIAALASRYGCTRGVTFDREAARAPGMKLVPMS